MLEDLISCNTSPENCGPNTDHIPILTCLETPLTPSTSPPTYNYREVDWKKFNTTLKTELVRIGPPRTITSEQEFQRIARGVDTALWKMLEKEVPKTRPHPHVKHCKTAFTFRAIHDHPIHSLHKAKAKDYDKAIKDAKRHHWRDWLEEANDKDLWTANSYISRPQGDGSKSRIPTLKHTDMDSTATMISSNKDKSRLTTNTQNQQHDGTQS
ncbi:hypothetical protein M404DRAFT_20106 [Pisolithus tinctorius Marx 270]|uniref:Uncharacterized protein n=1 Tax=Pisolithus tinctorius Marx 270 TaxID=870435 RepID=A0A0C3JT17_PISTI|nr:hypothetical protein M404DRAFT_20106 [Pisolithus tinctorius Marx 270]